MDYQLSLRPSGITSVSAPLSTNQSTASTAAFNNPLITDLIFHHLDSSDTSACLAVCKDWNAFFQPYHWQSISHYYIYLDGYGYSGHPPNQWWESRDKQVNARLFQYLRWQSKHSNCRSPFISSQQKELICRNAFRVRSLKVDYSAYNLLDVSFTNLARLCVTCWYQHSDDPIVVAGDSGTVERFNAEVLLQKKVLDMISLHPRLRELEVSYSLPTHQVVGALVSYPLHQLLLKSFQPRQSSSPTTLTASTTIASELHSLKLNIYGTVPFADICWVVENCPPSLQELTVQCSTWTKQGNFCSARWSDGLERRFAWMKSNASNSFQRHLPALRRLDLCWLSPAVYGKEINLVDPERFLFPLLACFPTLQELTVPKITSRLLDGGSTLIPALVSHCPALTTVNFGENMISEEHMFRFIMDMPQRLQGLTTKIAPSSLTRVLPALLKRSGPTLQHLRLAEVGFDHSQLRSTYIADILVCCPRLKSLFVLPKAQPASKVGIQDLLGAKWVCSGLETLSISINEVTVAEVPKSETLHGQLEAVVAVMEDEEIRIISDFYRRLRTLPFLRALDLRWNPACQKAITVREKASFSDELLTVDNLKWMGFSLS